MQGTWEDTKDLDYHKGVGNGSMVLSIGGGIGIDRVVKWMLRKKHIGEVQVSVWPKESYEKHTGLLK